MSPCKINGYSTYFRGLYLLAALGLTACGTSIDQLCQEVADCQGWSEAQLEQCRSESNAQRDLAEDAGCAEESDAWVDCVYDHRRCEGEQFIYADACGDLLTSIQRCILPG